MYIPTFKEPSAKYIARRSVETWHATIKLQSIVYDRQNSMSPDYNKTTIISKS